MHIQKRKPLRTKGDQMKNKSVCALFIIIIINVVCFYVAVVRINRIVLHFNIVSLVALNGQATRSAARFRPV